MNFFDHVSRGNYNNHNYADFAQLCRALKFNENAQTVQPAPSVVVKDFNSSPNRKMQPTSGKKLNYT